MTTKPNIFLRVLRATWRTIDGFRRLVLNLVFLFILLIVIDLMIEDGGTVIGADTTLVLAPQGLVVEQYSSDPTDRAMGRLFDDDPPETLLRDLISAVERATDDIRIQRMLIHPDYLWGIGLSKLQELRVAIEGFRAAGKRVYAYSQGMAQHQYYLAALADEVWLHPDGLVLLEGYGLYRNYYKEGLDKLGVDVHLFRVGEYKSAAEPFIRNDMSEASRESNRYWLEGLWTTYIEDVAAARSLDSAQLAAEIDGFGQRLRDAGGRASQAALDAGLVDRLATFDEMRQHLIEIGAYNDDRDSFRQVGFESYAAATAPRMRAQANEIAIVVAQGVILGGDQPQGTVGGESTGRLLREAREDDDVVAIVLRVDSPGGSVLPSEQIRREVELARQAGIPVVVSMSTVAASGGYWIAMSADEIWANPATITGSIGIYGLVTTFPRTLAKIGIHTDGVGTTELAGALRPDRALPESIAEIIQQIIDDGYNKFIARVAEARQMMVDEVDRVARGRVWSGRQALDRGLIDHLGGLSQAVASAANLGGVASNYRVRYYERQPTQFEQILLDLTASAPPLLGSLATFGNAWLAPLRRLPMATDLELLRTATNERLAMFAYCFCTVM